MMNLVLYQDIHLEFCRSVIRLHVNRIRMATSANYGLNRKSKGQNVPLCRAKKSPSIFALISGEKLSPNSVF